MVESREQYEVIIKVIFGAPKYDQTRAAQHKFDETIAHIDLDNLSKPKMFDSQSVIPSVSEFYCLVFCYPGSLDK